MYLQERVKNYKVTLGIHPLRKTSMEGITIMSKVPVLKTMLTKDSQITVKVSDDSDDMQGVGREKKKFWYSFKQRQMQHSACLRLGKQLQRNGIWWFMWRRDRISFSVNKAYTCLESLKSKDKNTQKNTGVRKREEINSNSSFVPSFIQSRWYSRHLTTGLVQPGRMYPLANQKNVSCKEMV